MKMWSALTKQPDAIADYLADREGLQGTVRSRFIELLDISFGFKLQHPNWSALALSASVASVAMAGVFLELRRGLSTESGLLWFGVIGLGLVLMCSLVRAHGQSRQGSREIEWRAYCLLIRPLILAEHPGLLNRNLAGESKINPQAIPVPAVADILRGSRPINLWLPASAGWSVGAASLVCWQSLGGAPRWVFVLPLLGSCLGPLAWGLFRRSAYARVKRLVRDKS